LAFTAEEAYFACKNIKVKKDSVLIDGYAEDINLKFIDPVLMQRWAKIFTLRNEVYAALEKARANKIIGSSLEGVLSWFCRTVIMNFLSRITIL